MRGGLVLHLLRWQLLGPRHDGGRTVGVVLKPHRRRPAKRAVGGLALAVGFVLASCGQATPELSPRQAVARALTRYDSGVQGLDGDIGVTFAQGPGNAGGVKAVGALADHLSLDLNGSVLRGEARDLQVTGSTVEGALNGQAHVGVVTAGGASLEVDGASAARLPEANLLGGWLSDPRQALSLAASLTPVPGGSTHGSDQDTDRVVNVALSGAQAQAAVSTWVQQATGLTYDVMPAASPARLRGSVTAGAGTLTLWLHSNGSIDQVRYVGAVNVDARRYSGALPDFTGGSGSVTGEIRCRVTVAVKADRPPATEAPAPAPSTRSLLGG